MYQAVLDITARKMFIMGNFKYYWCGILCAFLSTTMSKTQTIV